MKVNWSTRMRRVMTQAGVTLAAVVVIVVAMLWLSGTFRSGKIEPATLPLPAVEAVWIGANAITIYLASSVANFHRLAQRIVGGDVAVWLGPYADSVTAFVALALALWLVRFLYRRQIFLRL